MYKYTYTSKGRKQLTVKESNNQKSERYLKKMCRLNRKDLRKKVKIILFMSTNITPAQALLSVLQHVLG
jgi:hypothetical protein